MPKKRKPSDQEDTRELQAACVWMAEGLLIKASLVGKWEAADIAYDEDEGTITIHRKTLDDVIKGVRYEPDARKSNRTPRK